MLFTAKIYALGLQGAKKKARIGRRRRFWEFR